jgi:hypothetical protein
VTPALRSWPRGTRQLSAGGRLLLRLPSFGVIAKHLDAALVRWAMRKYKRFRGHNKRARTRSIPSLGSSGNEYDWNDGGPVNREAHAGLCVQRRLACSVGGNPTGARISSPVAWVAVAVHPNGATHVRPEGATLAVDFSVSDGVIISRFWVLFHWLISAFVNHCAGRGNSCPRAPSDRRHGVACRASKRRAICSGTLHPTH